MTCGVPDTGKDADSCGGFAHQDLWIVDGTTAAARFATAPMPVDEQPMVGSVHGQGRGGPALAGNHRQRPAVHAHDAAAHTAHARQGRAGRRSHPCTAAHDVMSNETKCHMSDLTAACMLLTFASLCHTLDFHSMSYTPSAESAAFVGCVELATRDTICFNKQCLGTCEGAAPP